ncbi:MAG: PD-(D/E)XK nuclease family protein [Bacteroidales bacterium]|nr:PD-(D/E)XK nuclease family protein [Bacteroidales bacterium]MBN2749428.1 PD-(D/E)XK nuclease family protein [Bacteroidales bacterium]
MMISEMNALIGKIQGLTLSSSNLDPVFGPIPHLYNYISQKEIVHSNIIADFLNPNAKHNCGNLFVLSFLKTIKVDKIDANASYNVSTEYPIKVKGDDTNRRIDILITWGDNAVIIENKLNNAIDQPNQLQDYYNCIQRAHNENENTCYGKYNVQKVVYIPASNNKSANRIGLKKCITDRLVDIYPCHLIKWLSECSKENSVKAACEQYISLLEHINQSNLRIMDAEKILDEFADNDKGLEKLISVSNIISSADWNIAILQRVYNQLSNGDSKLIFEKKEKRYAQLYYEDYKYWVELYFYGDHFKLWIAINSGETLSDEILKIFKLDSEANGYKYFKDEERFEYKFPNSDENRRMINDLKYILGMSKK